MMLLLILFTTYMFKVVVVTHNINLWACLGNAVIRTVRNETGAIPYVSAGGQRKGVQASAPLSSLP